ncbi:AbiH family protein [Fructilactobacillus fructivorans]|uniref:Bacteriophage abortive infection AbiH n=1 Tax=Fructilactobacillus fructivorans TaxID=1614 RepID=A0AAE6TVJ8_9LACO|nr:AbiH family protein [Fructilactobacillus fructivorans]KRK58114.1 hypothetical protein FC73_GL000493 [Fructilactobacillus fructivorans]KRN13059.1 hypothetical protein IV37_GL000696 [Fructilactobacillus fructivorans]KRN41345.1 hypothetical protein IV51_GL000667 [Fructilactobacillus fructivorans]QFX92114.1 hypothetical protein LF543_00305 [Fructilactobacillus fructivorans]RDV65162.1 hypothetical protein DXU76_04045 [Fructilactobacillus fructivorans]
MSDNNVKVKENKQGDSDTLVIIGNGFDLSLGLKTRFQDYFDKNKNNDFVQEKENFNDLLNKISKDTTINPNKISKGQMFETIENYFKDFNSTILSFWDLYLLLLRYINKNNTNSNKLEDWSDVETQIKRFFTENNENKSNDFNKLIWTQELRKGKQLYGYGEHDSSHGINWTQTVPNSSFDKDDFKRIILPFLLEIQNNKNDTYNELLNQLNKFEQNFSNYILKLPIKGDDYSECYQNKLNKISESTWYNVLTFNYTPVPTKTIFTCEVKRINHVRYIHGTVVDKKIIPL